MPEVSSWIILGQMCPALRNIGGGVSCDMRAVNLVLTLSLGLLLPSQLLRVYCLSEFIP